MNIQTDSEVKELNDRAYNAYHRMRKLMKRLTKIHLCEDCGTPTNRDGYCLECDLRHEQFSRIANEKMEASTLSL